MKKVICISLIMALAVFAVFANGSGEASGSERGIAGTVENPRILKAGSSAQNPTDPTSAMYIGAHALNDKLMELSGGTIGYECVGGGALGNNTQLLAQLRAGTLDLMPTGFDLATNLQKSEKFNAVAMPYVWTHSSHQISGSLW